MNGMAGADAHEEQASAEGPMAERWSADARLTLFATLAWLHDYMPMLKIEAEENGAVDAVPNHISSYRLKQLSKANETASRDAAFWKSALRISQVNEQLKRESNMHYISFSQVCACHSASHVLPVLRLYI